MKHIDYLYFNIYNYFNRISPYQQSLNARIQAMFFFSLGSGGWLLLIESMYLHLVKHAWFPSKGGAAIFATAIYMLTAVFFHYIFIVKDRDQKIIGKYEERASENPKEKRDLIISIGILMMPYVALFSLAIWHKHQQP